MTSATCCSPQSDSHPATSSLCCSKQAACSQSPSQHSNQEKVLGIGPPKRDSVSWGKDEDKQRLSKQKQPALKQLKLRFNNLRIIFYSNLTDNRCAAGSRRPMPESKNMFLHYTHYFSPPPLTSSTTAVLCSALPAAPHSPRALLGVGNTARGSPSS